MSDALTYVHYMYTYVEFQIHHAGRLNVYIVYVWAFDAYVTALPFPAPGAGFSLLRAARALGLLVKGHAAAFRHRREPSRRGVSGLTRT